MKKQIFLLSVGLLFSSQIVPDCNTNCNTSCTPCVTSTSNCNSCQLEHGKTRFDVTPHFQNASPELASLFNSDAVSNLVKDDKHGIFEVAVFGGKSTKCSQAAAMFLPYGNTTLTFDGSLNGTVQTFAQVLAESDVAILAGSTPAAKGEIHLNGAGDVIGGTVDGSAYLLTDAATYKFDSNKDTSRILPWNFGITFAALFEPRGASASGSRIGSGLITAPEFKSTICPTYTYSHVGAGLGLRYHFSDDKNGWFGFITTAVQHVKSRFKLNENVETQKSTLLNSDLPTLSLPPTDPTTAVNPYGVILDTGVNTQATTAADAGQNPYVTLTNATTDATTTPTGSLRQAYIGSGFPTDEPDASGAANAASAPANVAEAFNQTSWKYGKVADCASKITRLADIEIALGYQWMCGDCASTNWYVGLVIPTGNKAKADYIAPAVVGNGQHVGIMTGSQTEVMLSDECDYQTWYRLDMNCRYLFRNTQKASFDLLGKEWSRYMMVWESKEAYTAALTSLTADFTGQRAYTPGINVFTTDFYIKPGFQGRVNQAVYFQGEKFRAELGWNTFARQKDCTSLACDWKSAPAFADSSYVGGVGLNNNRTIFNDSQTTSVNQLTENDRVNATPVFVGVADAVLSADLYDSFVITEKEINFDSVSTPAAITQTPYLVLGYAFDCFCDTTSNLSIGASYEFTRSNSALNQWLVWGKFEIGF